VVPFIFSTLCLKSPAFESTVKSNALISAGHQKGMIGDSPTPALNRFSDHVRRFLPVGPYVHLEHHTHLGAYLLFHALLLDKQVGEGVRRDVRYPLHNPRFARLLSVIFS
jgi:hypothetical protein